MRSTSRMPTERPWRVRASASWRVTEDLPTPPLPERTWLELTVSQSIALFWDFFQNFFVISFFSLSCRETVSGFAFVLWGYR